MLAPERLLDVRHGVGDFFFRRGKDADGAQPVGSEHAEPTRVERNQDLLVGIAEWRGLALRLENANDEELDAANADILSQQRIRSLESHVGGHGHVLLALVRNIEHIRHGWSATAAGASRAPGFGLPRQQRTVFLGHGATPRSR